MQNQDINGILSSSADRECLNEVLRIMNLLLLSTFIGNTEQSVIIQDI